MTLRESASGTSVEMPPLMLTMLVIAPLLCGQVTLDAPGRSASLADVRVKPDWVEPSLWVMGASLVLPMAVSSALVIAGASAFILAIGGLAAFIASSLVAGVMWGLSLEDNVARVNGPSHRRLAMWPWVTTALTLLVSSSVAMGLGVLATFGDFFGRLIVVLMTGLTAGPAVVVLLLTGLVVGIVNASRTPSPRESEAIAASRRGVEFLTF